MIVCVPTDRVVSTAVAVPVLLSATVAIVVEPSVNITLPVGLPEKLVILAVKVTLWPRDEALSDDVSVAEVCPASTASPVKEITCAALLTFRLLSASVSVPLVVPEAGESGAKAMGSVQVSPV